MKGTGWQARPQCFSQVFLWIATLQRQEVTFSV